MPQPGYEGYADLGEILAGAAPTKGVFGKDPKATVALEAALANAKIARDKAMAREGLRGKMGSAMPDLPPEMVDLLAALTSGSESTGTGFSAAQQGMGRMQQNTARQRALDQPMPGTEGYGDITPDALNQVLAIAGDKLLSPTNVDVLPQARGKERTQDATTILRDAQTESAKQGAKAHEAAAEASHARAAATTTKTPSESADLLKQAHQKIAEGADPKEVADYLISKGYPDVAAKVYKPPKKTGY